ncbi:MAG: Rhodanese-related sulfurtransferase [Chitinophagaceae bacterium]|nr:Rhodanese-related sulfurtransferase [Chitinophagaceae bacterium]
MMGMVCCFVLSAASCQVGDSSAVSNDSFRVIAAEKNAVILDVRTASEFTEGHLPSAINIDVLQKEAFTRYVSKLDKNATYLLYCRSGKRSATAVSIMKENGFTSVKHLVNGITGWDGPVTKQ